jgi:glycosyltransferase involved in cell wall biosynthesis
VLNALTGLGFTFASKTMRAQVLRWFGGLSLGWLLTRGCSTTLVQNPNDRDVICRFGVPLSRIAMIAGSGVDIDAFTPMPEPPDYPPTIAYVGRLLDHKGVRVLVRAHEILVERDAHVRLLLAGAPDPLNPASISARELAVWSGQPTLTLLGHVEDVHAVWRQAHIAVLPSRGGEGIPMSLLEAAACARPIVATDVPGCREIARDGVNALLVPPNDAVALADAIGRLAGDAELRRRFGAAGRRMAENEFSHIRIGQEVVALYRRLLGQDQEQG